MGQNPNPTEKHWRKPSRDLSWAHFSVLAPPQAPLVHFPPKCTGLLPPRNALPFILLWKLSSSRRTKLGCLSSPLWSLSSLYNWVMCIFFLVYYPLNTSYRVLEFSGCKQEDEIQANLIKEEQHIDTPWEGWGETTSGVTPSLDLHSVRTLSSLFLSA